MIGQVSRFEPDHRQAKTLVDDGMIGQAQMVKHSITTSFPGWSEGGWLADAKVSGGPLVDLSVHSFDYLSWVTGSPAVRVTAVGADSAAGPVDLRARHRPLRQRRDGLGRVQLGSPRGTRVQAGQPRSSAPTVASTGTTTT